MTSRASIVLIFLDGVGIGAADADRNPFFSARLPHLTRLLGGLPSLETPEQRGPGGICIPLDATLGVAGRPQSGTGQTALLTGVNAARVFGRHFGPWTPVRLRPVLEARNVLRRVRDAGHTVAFANAYPEWYFDRVVTRRIAAPPLAARSAGVFTRHHLELARGDAVASGIVNDGWRDGLGYQEVPEIDPGQAGANLAKLAEQSSLTLYAHYDTDHAGHRAEAGAAEAALERVDAFMGGLLESTGDDTLVIVASDHGNIEDLARGHTTNPIPGMLLGRGPRLAKAAEHWGSLRSILDVAPWVLTQLGIADA